MSASEAFQATLPAARPPCRRPLSKACRRSRDRSPSRSAPPRAPDRVGRAEPSVIVAASAGWPGHRPVPHAPEGAASPLPRTAVHRRCAPQHHRRLRVSGRGEPKVRPPFRAPRHGQAARVKWCRGASACPTAGEIRDGSSPRRRAAPARRARRCHAIRQASSDRPSADPRTPGPRAGSWHRPPSSSSPPPTAGGAAPRALTSIPVPWAEEYRGGARAAKHSPMPTSRPGKHASAGQARSSPHRP